MAGLVQLSRSGSYRAVMFQATLHVGCPRVNDLLGVRRDGADQALLRQLPDGSACQTSVDLQSYTFLLSPCLSGSLHSGLANVAIWEEAGKNSSP